MESSKLISGHPSVLTLGGTAGLTGRTSLKLSTRVLICCYYTAYNNVFMSDTWLKPAVTGAASPARQS